MYKMPVLELDKQITGSVAATEKLELWFNFIAGCIAQFWQ